MTSALTKPFYGLLHEFGGIILFYREIARTLIYCKGNLKPILEQVADVSIRSMSTVVFSGLFVGAILVLQFNLILLEYDAQSFLGGLNTSACVREVAPLIISFLLAGKVGAYTAAELGTMRVTEQIDAIRCLGTNPMQYLIVPRFVGIVLSSMILLMFGLTVSVLGSILVATTMCDMNTLQYLTSIPKFTSFSTLVAGMGKSLVYGTIVAGVACFKGYTASGGARGVGKAVTMAAVYTNLYIVIANYLMSNVLTYFQQLSLWMAGAP